MLTPKDLINPARKSGYDHVTDRGGRAREGHYPFQAQVYGGKTSKAGHAWMGPRRATALEAAQDYCNYINAQAKLLTPQSIENPSRKSGYDHVSMASSLANPRPLPYQARVGWDGSLPAFRGPRRATGVEAAQDACDHINGNPVTLPVTRVPDITPSVRGMTTSTTTRKEGFRDAQKKAIHARANGVCECCDEPYPHPEAHHIDPNGLNSMENGSSLCKNCHGRITYGTDDVAEELNNILREKRKAELKTGATL